MKKIKMFTALILALFVLTACDSSADNAPAGNSRTYTRTGTEYYDDAGYTYYGNWTDRTTITGSADKTQIRVYQEEKLEGNYPEMVYETIYTFSKPITNAYFNGDTYTLTIVAQGDTYVTTKMCEIRKESWTKNSARSALIYVRDLDNPAEGNFFAGYTLKPGKRYGVFAEHYEPEFATVGTCIHVR